MRARLYVRLIYVEKGSRSLKRRFVRKALNAEKIEMHGCMRMRKCSNCGHCENEKRFAHL